MKLFLDQFVFFEINPKKFEKTAIAIDIFFTKIKFNSLKKS